MNATLRATQTQTQTKFLDRFTLIMLVVMIVLLLIIFASAKIMSAHNMDAAGTDDKVNGLAEDVSKTTAHPFLDLPGDTQVAAFSIANFFAGIIIGYSVVKLFVRKEGLETGGNGAS